MTTRDPAACAAKRSEKMMSIPEACIERVRFKNANTCESMEDAERRARRVFLALAEEMPADAVDAFIRAFWLMPPGHNIEHLFSDPARLSGERARVATSIAAFLTHVAGDAP